MLESLPVSILIATILGFLSGLGIGGGSLLILWLTFVLGWDHQTARGMNLLFFVPSAVIASVFRLKQGFIPGRTILPGIIAGCAAALGASLLSYHLDIEILKKIFGVLLIATGLRELLTKKKKPSS